MRRRAFPLFLAVAVAALVWTAASAAVVKPPVVYKGTWFGTTGQGHDLSFTVNKKNRLTLLELAFEVESEDCSVEVEKTIRGVVATVKAKAFKVTRKTAQDSFTLKGRFTSKTVATGTLEGTVTDPDGCEGTVATTWRVKKGKKPPVDRTYDGEWEGPLTLAGVAPDILETLGGISFGVENGAVEFVGLPAVARGAGCTAIRIPGLGASFSPPLKIVKHGFSAAADAGFGWSFSVTGGFDSPAAASGTVSITGSSGFPGGFGFCSGTATGTWTATKQAPAGG